MDPGAGAGYQHPEYYQERDDGGLGAVPAAAAQSGVPGVPPYDGIPGVPLPGVLPAGVLGNAAVPAPAPGPVRRTTPLTPVTTTSFAAIDACAPGGAPGPVQDQGQGQGQLWLPVPRLWQDLHPRLAPKRWVSYWSCKLTIGKVFTISEKAPTPG